MTTPKATERGWSGRHRTIATAIVTTMFVVAVPACGAKSAGTRSGSKTPSVSRVTANPIKRPHPEGSPTVSRTSESTPATTMQTTPRTRTSVPVCSPSRLTLSFGPSREDAGSFTQSFTLSNGGHRSCRLGGWPGFQVANSSGHKVKTKAIRYRTNKAPKPAWKSVTLKPEGSASFNVTGADYNSVRNKSCSRTSAVYVIPPGATKQLKAKVKIYNCSNSYMIVPLISGRIDLHPPTSVVK